MAHALLEDKDREFEMTAADYGKIKKLAMDWTGITLTDHKKNMIYGRLSRRLRTLSLRDFRQYCDLLTSNPGEEKTNFINSITTNLTSFFREGHHFDFLADKLLPELISKNTASRKIRIWSAGCSTGEEPYSIAMAIANCQALKHWDVKILATDLDTNVVRTGSEGIYAYERAEKIPKQYRKYFDHNEVDDTVTISQDAKKIIRFRSLNLLQDWPMKNKFDIIFCRNVVIYFDLETQKKLFNRYADILKDNAHLFIGHSENLYKVTDRFEGIGRTIYQKNY